MDHLCAYFTGASRSVLIFCGMVGLILMSCAPVWRGNSSVIIIIIIIIIVILLLIAV